MGINSTIARAVDIAFDKMGDLVKSVTLTKNAVTGFDFSSAAVTEDTPTVLTVSAIVVGGVKGGDSKNPERNTQRKTIKFKTADVGDLTFYEKVQIDGDDWQLDGRIEDNGFVVTSEIYRER